MASLGPLAACDSTDSVAPSAPLANVVSAALDTALNDEYHAETIYLRVLADFGNVLPFFNAGRRAAAPASVARSLSGTV
jgi:hypothetical protein